MANATDIIKEMNLTISDYNKFYDNAIENEKYRLSIRKKQAMTANQSALDRAEDLYQTSIARIEESRRQKIANIRSAAQKRLDALN